MARELTIQIRLTKEEHDTIAAQAGRDRLSAKEIDAEIKAARATRGRRG